MQKARDSAFSLYLRQAQYILHTSSVLRGMNSQCSYAVAYLFRISHFTTHWAKACSAAQLFLAAFLFSGTGRFKLLPFSVGRMWRLNWVSILEMIYTHIWADMATQLLTILDEQQCENMYGLNVYIYVSYSVYPPFRLHPPLEKLQKKPPGNRSGGAKKGRFTKSQGLNRVIIVTKTTTKTKTMKICFVSWNNLAIII